MSRGEDIGIRMIKAFGHNLNITAACSQSQPHVLRFLYTHLPIDRGFTDQFIITVWAPPPTLSWVVTTKLDECLVTINTNNTPHSPTPSISQKTGYTKATLRIVSHNKEKLFSIIISPYVRVLEKHIDSECLKFI